MGFFVRDVNCIGERKENVREGSILLVIIFRKKKRILSYVL